MPRAPAAVRTIPGTNRPWPLDKRGQPWPRSRFGQPLRPLDEYPPGVRAPGEGYTGPIADPEKAMRAALASKDVLAQAARYAADPDAPIRAYLSARDVWENPGKYAGWPRPEATPAPARVPSQTERDGSGDRFGIDEVCAAGTDGAASETDHTKPADERHHVVARIGAGFAASGQTADVVRAARPRVLLASSRNVANDMIGALPGLENYGPDGRPLTTGPDLKRAIKEAFKEVVSGPGKVMTWFMDTPNDPVTFVDAEGKPMLDQEGQTMQRPSGLDPHFFVRTGLQDKAFVAAMVRSGQGGPAGAYIASQLAKFAAYYPWDAQRLDRGFHHEYVKYATVVIGLYAAALGLPEDHILDIQNSYASVLSDMKESRFDSFYTNLPEDNVWNTRLGYELYRSGRIRAETKP